MKIIISGIVLFIIWCICKYPEWKFDNQLPPNGYTTDWKAMNHDLASGKPKNDVIKKSNSGEYYIRKDK